ncbi:MAG: diguanylate cyclase [Myxococcota bacterium]
MTSQSVLLIDDSSETHALLSADLGPEDVVVVHARSAIEGMRIAREAPCDLVLLDIHVEPIGGLETCHRLKADPRTATIPIIFLTTCCDTETKVRALELGAVDFVTKPFEPRELRARVRSALRTKSYLDLLASRAQVDGLTGLWNRAWFDEQLAAAVSRTRAEGGCFCLILFDVDHFKEVNDRFGHPFGDRALQAVARHVGAVIRGTDAFCRYGGEEFAVVLPDADVGAACRVAERMRGALLDLGLCQDGHAVPVTASFGVASSALFDGVARWGLDDLVQAADRALYTSKSAGRDRVTRAPGT